MEVSAHCHSCDQDAYRLNGQCDGSPCAYSGALAPQRSLVTALHNLFTLTIEPMAAMAESTAFGVDVVLLTLDSPLSPSPRIMCLARVASKQISRRKSPGRSKCRWSGPKQVTLGGSRITVYKVHSPRRLTSSCFAWQISGSRLSYL
jgi:hypothetical protein